MPDIEQPTPTPRPGTVIDIPEACFFLNQAAKYFENRPTHGEDRAYWANIYNAENCRKIISLLTNEE